MNSIRELRKKKGVTQTELGDYLGVTKNSVSYYENGKRQLSPEMLIKLSEYFGVTVDAILGRSPDDPEPPAKPSLTNFDPASLPIKFPKGGYSPLPDLDTETALAPILGSVYAGYDYMAEENFTGYLEIEEALKSRFPDIFALRVKGNSMEPEIYPGSLVLCVPSLEVRSGDLAIVCTNGDEGTVKRVKITSDGITLIPSNKAYPESTFTPKQVRDWPVIIQAKVIEVRRRFI